MSRYAGVVTRLAALSVDGVVIAIAVPAVANGPPSFWASIEGSAPGWLKALCQSIAAVIPILYFALCWWATGQTLGGLLFGTVVRRADGTPLTLLRSLLRAFVGLLVPILWLAGLITALWDPKRRALHDRLFGTVVWYKQRKVLAI
jgi:uncharacterized RDD family membrane protein YckC